MKKMRLKKILGLFLAVSMVVQINGGFGLANVYADSTGNQITEVSEVQNDNADETAAASESGETSGDTVTATDADDASTVAADSNAEQITSGGDAAMSESSAEQTSDSGDVAADSSSAEQAAAAGEVTTTDDSAEQEADAGQTSVSDAAEESEENAADASDEETSSDEIVFERQSFSDGSYVEVTAPAGAFPEGVQLTVEQQSAADVLEEARTASGNEDLTEDNVVAYDFDFYLGEEHDLEPEKAISVTFHNVALAGSNDEQNFSVYHIDDDDSVEQVSEQDLSEQSFSDQNVSFTMQADQFSTYMVLRASAATTQGIWIGDDTDTTYDTLAEAISAADEGAVIHMSGTFDSTQVSGNTINKEITLDIAGDTTIAGTSSNSGLIIADGSVLQCSNGATLSMSGFTGTDKNQAAIVVQDGGTWTDGNYVFTNNFYAFYNQGAINGSSGRDQLVISSDNTGLDKSLSMAAGSTATFTNATITIRMNRNSDQDGQDAGMGGPLVLNNVKLDTQNLRFCLQGTGQTINGEQYVLYAVDSEIYVSGRWPGNRNKNGSYQTFMVESNKGYMSNSQLYVSGSRIGANSEFEVTNGSLISVTDSQDGGLSANWGGTFILKDSTMEEEGLSFPFYGTGSSGTNRIRIEGNSVINTPAEDANIDNGGLQGSGSYVVMGGSFLIKYNSSSVTIPTNDNNEKLTYFKLADPSVTTIDVPSSGYTYPVQNASSDGNKYVWVPGAKVTFELNKEDAYFADGTTSDKIRYAMGGYTMSDATSVNGEEDLATVPDNPVALGYEFTGWYYMDGNEEKAFDPDSVTIPADGLTVYAKWEGTENYGVVYHQNLDTTDEPTILVSGSSPDRTMTVLTWDEILSKNADFEKSGYQFVSWNTEADGSGTTYAPGDVITLADDVDELDLYAQYDPVYITVTFSANGGTFDEDSIIKQHPAVFDVSTDAQGGEIAVLKGDFQAGSNLNDYIRSLDASWSSPYSDLNSTSSFATRKYYTQKSETWWFWDYYYWYTDAEGKTQASFTSDTVINTDTTYYVGWDLDDSIEHIQADNLTLDGDMYSDTDLYTSSDTRQLFQGETFALSGSIDVTPVKDRMDSLGDWFDETVSPAKAARATALLADDSSASSGITLENCSSEFTAVLTIPEGIDIPSNPTVTLTGLDGLFEVQDGSVTVDETARTITVPLTLIKSYDSYDDLYKDVQNVEDTAVVTVSGFAISDDVYTDTSSTDTFNLIGAVTGEFSSFAIKGDITKKFDFSWTAVQQDEGRQDGQAASDPTIQYTVQAARDDDMTLYGDILVGDDTQNSSVYQVVQGDEVDFTGALDVTDIQEQLTYLEDSFGVDDTSEITLKKTDETTDGVEFSMTINVTFPDGITVPEDLTAEVEDDSFGAFAITGTEVDGQNVTVTFGLADDTISTYTELKAAVDRAGIDGNGLMKILLPGLTVTTANENLTVRVNSFTGSFHAFATSGSITKAFAYAWTAEQSSSTSDSALLGNGKDSTQASDDNTIAFTLIANQKEALDGDILINGDTEHDSIYSASVGDKLTYTATYDVSSIKDKMSAIEEQFGATDWTDDQYAQITLSNIESVFTTEIEVPDALSDVWPTDISSYTLSGTDAFTITDVTRDGNTVSVTMTLKDGYDTYDKLRNDIKNDENTAQVLTLTVAPFAIPSTIDTNTNITVVGSVSGYMHADAALDSTSVHFAFGWQSTQDKDIPVGSEPDGGGDGTDKILENAEDTTQISATFRVTSSEPSVTPEPETPEAITVDDPPVEKVITGDDPEEAETFQFTLTADPESSSLPSDMAEDSMPMPSDADGSQSLTKTIAGEGTTEFGSLTFSEEGTYVYKVSEISGEADGYTYDDTVYTITYVITETDGELICTRTIQKDGVEDSTLTTLTFTNSYQTPTTADDEETTSETTTTSTTITKILNAVGVKTGDDTPIGLWIGLLCIAGVVCVILIGAYVHRKRKRDKK